MKSNKNSAELLISNSENLIVRSSHEVFLNSDITFKYADGEIKLNIESKADFENIPDNLKPSFIAILQQNFTKSFVIYQGMKNIDGSLNFKIANNSEEKIIYASWQCQKCGKNIGWLPRLIESILPFTTHQCKEKVFEKQLCLY